MDINYRLLSPIWCLATMFVGCLGGPGVEPPAEPEDKVKHFGDNGEGDHTTAIALPDAGIGMGGMTGSVTTQTTGAGGSIAKGAAGTAGVTKTGAAGKSGAADVAVDAGGEPPAGTGGAGKTGASGKKAGAAGKTGAGGKRAGEGAGGTIGGAGVGGAAGTAGTGGGPATDQPKPPCLQDPRQVVLIGDSYITWVTHTFPNDLATASGDIYPSYRNYAVGRYAMASGGTGLIPPQFDRAVADNPDIIAAVVSGGANDVWIADTAQYPNGDSCKNDPNSPNIPDCQAIAQRALEAFTALVDRMANAGVKDIVYIFYPRVPAPTFLGGRSPNEIADYARPKYKAVCDGATARTSGKLNCHFLDLNTVLDDQNGEPITALFAATDIHPNRLGSNRMAEAVWSLMKKSCIAQQVSSGCCAP